MKEKTSPRRPGRRGFVKLAGLAAVSLLVPGSRDFGKIPPEQEPAMGKGRVFLHFMFHHGFKGALCGFGNSLASSNPTHVFMESANTSHEAAERGNFQLNNSSMYTLSSSFAPHSLAFLGQVRKFSSEKGRNVRFLHAESYSQPELDARMELMKRLETTDRIRSAAMREGNVRRAVDVTIARERMWGEMMFSRNVRVVETVGRLMDKEWKSALVIIGGMHFNLARLFSDEGYVSAIVGPASEGSDRLLPVRYEAIERGWEVGSINERDAASAAFAHAIFFSNYVWDAFDPESGFRVFPPNHMPAPRLPIEDHWKISNLISAALRGFSEGALWELRELALSGKTLPQIIGYLKLELPASRDEFDRMSRNRGYDRCD